MNLDALLNEIDQLHSVSSRLEGLAERHLPISEALVAVAGSVRNSAVVLEVLIATKSSPPN
jgi:hypothetical protein